MSVCFFPSLCEFYGSSCASPCISPPLRYNRYTVKIPKDVISIARRYDKQGAKRRILSVCVRLFIEKGYARTTTAEILKLADVANGSFYNIFDSKDAILKELAAFMFDNQFDTAYRNLNGSGEEDPILLYAVETSLQITLTELNENLREIYVEAYTQPRVAEYIHHRTTEEICRIFRSCLPQATEQDFYELEIGAEGIMRMFAEEPEVIELGARFLRLISLMYFLPALTNGIQGFFRGIGDLKITLRSSMLSMAARVPSAALLVLYFHMEIEALPWSYAFGWFLMLVYEVPPMLRFLRSGTMEGNE